MNPINQVFARKAYIHIYDLHLLLFLDNDDHADVSVEQVTQMPDIHHTSPRQTGQVSVSGLMRPLSANQRPGG